MQALQIFTVIPSGPKSQDVQFTLKIEHLVQY